MSEVPGSAGWRRKVYRSRGGPKEVGDSRSIRERNTTELGRFREDGVPETSPTRETDLWGRI